MNTRSTSPPEWTGRGSPAAESVARLLADWSAGPGTISGRLAAALRGGCEREEIGTGSRLPSERALAAALAVSRTTIVAAYEQLRQEGRVESRQGSGTRVLPRDGDPPAARERRFSGEAVPATSTLVLRTLAEDQAGSISFLAAHLPGAGEILEPAFAKSRREVTALSRAYRHQAPGRSRRPGGSSRLFPGSTGPCPSCSPAFGRRPPVSSPTAGSRRGRTRSSS